MKTDDLLEFLGEHAQKFNMMLVKSNAGEMYVNPSILDSLALQSQIVRSSSSIIRPQGDTDPTVFEYTLPSGRGYLWGWSIEVVGDTNNAYDYRFSAINLDLDISSVGVMEPTAGYSFSPFNVFQNNPVSVLYPDKAVAKSTIKGSAPVEYEINFNFFYVPVVGKV